MRRGKITRLLLFYLFSILLSTHAFGQANEMEFDHYTTNDGLSNGYINSIMQDSKGFMWIGTVNGLNRFDGINFKTYFFDPKDTNSISGYSVNYLIEDSLGRIWVMTSGGICVYDRKMDRFSRKRLIINGNEPENLNLISGIIDSKGFLWVGSNSGIFRFKIYNDPSISTNKIYAEMYLLDEADLDKININIVYSFFEDEDGKIWATSFSNMLFCFETKHNKFIPQPINHPEATSFSSSEKAILKDKDGDIFITIEHVGLLEWDRKNNQYNLYKPNGNNTGPKGDILFALAEDENGLIWIGDRNDGGVSIFNKKTGKFTYIQSEESNPYSLNSNKINCIYRDRSGAMWVGSIIGISKYSPNKIKFKRYYNNSKRTDQLSFNNVLCFAENKK